MRTALVFALMMMPVMTFAQDPKGFFAKESGKLNAQETRGKGLFLQRCSICHLPQLPGRRPPYGPLLDGYFQKQPGTDREATMRKKILEGSPAMPGFQYGLQTKDVDDIIAYLKSSF